MPRLTVTGYSTGEVGLRDGSKIVGYVRPDEPDLRERVKWELVAAGVTPLDDDLLDSIVREVAALQAERG